MNRPRFLFLSFLLALSALPLPGGAAAMPDPVLDLDGKGLRTGQEYYILPVIRGRGGGLTLANTAVHGRCAPDYVVQAQSEVDRGIPLTFYPVNPKKGVVRVSTDLNIKFSTARACAQSTVWKLAPYDGSRKQQFITTGGVAGNPGPQTTDNWFKIEKFGHRDYKVVFCPSVCRYCKVVCRDIGIYYDENGKRRLALSNEPLLIKFKKASVPK